LTIGTRGVLQIRDGTSNTILIAESTGTASCSQDRDSGQWTLDSLTLLFRDPRTGQVVPVIIVVLDEIRPGSGVYAVEARIGDRVMEGTMTVRSLGPRAGARTGPAR
jgi:hypothetical protein